jgi:hypothetical protein
MLVMISAPENKMKEGDIIAKCEVCECEAPEEKIRHIEIKGKIKKICEGCVAAIKGFA